MYEYVYLYTYTNVYVYIYICTHIYRYMFRHALLLRRLVAVVPAPNHLGCPKNDV